MQSLTQDLDETAQRRDAQLAKWQQEIDLVNRISAHREELHSHYQGDQQDEKVIRKLKDMSRQSRANLSELQGDNPMVQAEVNAAAIAEIIADWTGIPIGKMLKDDANALMTFEDRIGNRVVGQDSAIASIGRAIRSARAGLSNPDAAPFGPAGETDPWRSVPCWPPLAAWSFPATGA